MLLGVGACTARAISRVQAMNPEATRIQRLRKDTPACSNLLHFNNAGASLSPSPVVEAQKDFIDLEARIGGYEACIQEQESLQNVYKSIATLLNCNPEEIALVQSATAAWDQVFYGLEFKEGDRVLTSLTEYGSNFIAFLQVVKRKGIKIDIIEETKEGDISIDHLEKLIAANTGRPALIAVTHIPTNSGRVYDAEAVGRIAKKHGIPYLLDACQSVGQMPVDVKRIGCDWLSATSRKYLRGPRGMGFLYASREAMKWSEPAMIDNKGARWESTHTYRLVDSALRYQQYERSFSAQMGLGVAVDYALQQGLEWIWKSTQHLSSHLRLKLAAIKGVKVHDHGRQLCGIVSFSKEGVDAGEAVEALRKENINVSSSYIPSTRLDFEARKLPHAVMRASVAYYNTEEEIALFVKAVDKLGVVQQQHTARSLLMGGLFRRQ